MISEPRIQELIANCKTPSAAWQLLLSQGIIPESKTNRSFMLDNPDCCPECGGTGLWGGVYGDPCYAYYDHSQPKHLYSKHPQTLKDVVGYAARWDSLLLAEVAADELLRRLASLGVSFYPARVWQTIGWSHQNSLPFWAWGILSDLHRLGVTPRFDPNDRKSLYYSFPAWADIADRAWASAVALGEKGILSTKIPRPVADLPNPFEPARTLAELGCGVYLSEEETILYFIT